MGAAERALRHAPGRVLGVQAAVHHDVGPVMQLQALACGVAGRVEPLTLRADSTTSRSYFPLDPAQVKDMVGILFVKRIEPALVS